MKTERKLPKPPRRKNRGNWSVPATCPGCAKNGTLAEHFMPSTQLIRGEEIHCKVKKWVCAVCDAAFMSPAQATEAVKQAVATYQVKYELLTADQIRTGRRRLSLSVSELADEADLGVATVKRIEAGTTVQRQSTNTLLLTILTDGEELPDYQITLNCSDFASCLPVLSAWSDEQPWNEKKPWKNGKIDMDFCAADSNELALAG